MKYMIKYHGKWRIAIMNKFLDLARKEIRELEAYIPAKREAKIIVNANENNWGAPKEVFEEICRAASNAKRYPDSTNTQLRKLLANRFGLIPENFIISNGLDGFFTMFCRAFLAPEDEVLVSDCTFSVYSLNVKIAGSSVIIVPVRDDFSQNLDDFYSKIKPNTKAIFYCNPNNPTGLSVPLAEIENFLKKLPPNILFILDEAYIEFSDVDLVESYRLLEKFDNLIICRTCSKICALAGLRIGYSAMHADLAHVISLVRETYCVSEVAEVAACASFAISNLIDTVKDKVKKGRKMLEQVLDLRGIRFLPSCTNFVYILPTEDENEKLAKIFDKHGIAVRFWKFRGQDTIRVTVGTEAEMVQIVNAIQNI